MKSVREVVEQKKKFQPILSEEHTKIKLEEPKIIGCRVSKEKLTIKLEDHREISVLINDLNKRWFFKDIKPEELKKYEIWGGGYTIAFPETEDEESIPIRIFTEGFNSHC